MARKAKKVATRRRKKKIVPQPERRAFTIEEFCTAFGFSEAFYYKLQKAGTGPRAMKVGSRTLISVEAADAWRREREQE